jgi:hypothetical protein
MLGSTGKKFLKVDKRRGQVDRHLVLRTYVSIVNQLAASAD